MSIIYTLASLYGGEKKKEKGGGGGGGGSNTNVSLDYSSTFPLIHEKNVVTYNRIFLASNIVEKTVIPGYM